MSKRSERELIDGAKRGDSEAVAELYRRYWGPARAAAYGVTADFASAEDAAAEGLQAALTSVGKLKDADRFGPWLRTIVVRAARRQRPRQANWEDLAALPEQLSPQDRLERRELALLVREAVDRLPGPLREAISLHYFEGYPVSEGASFLGVPAGTLKRRLHDGRRRLKETCAGLVQGRKPMNADRERLADCVDALLAEGADPAKFLELAREVMQLRPLPYELMHKLARGHLGPQLSGEAWQEKRGPLLEAMREHGPPSARTADPTHPVGRAVGAILDALPRFRRWEITPEEVLHSLEVRYGPDAPPEPRVLLPPGFQEGRPSAYLTLRTGIAVLDEQGKLRPIAEALRDAISHETAASRLDDHLRLSDVIDLLWMETRPLELREVENLLRELAGKVVAGSAVRFSPYEGPRYRAALCMHLGDCANPVAAGGVLRAWPEMVEGTDAAEVHMHLEVWASVISGTRVEFRSFPSIRLDSSQAPA
jgi:RNA polymerase sigma factor (sigma-70 family)